MEVTFLGTGTSHGVPVVTCDCETCKSNNIKNKRLRSSIYLKSGNKNIVVDTSPEFRLQCLNNNINQIDSVFYTHTHADHLHGIDDLRAYSVYNPINIYASEHDLTEIKQRFPYIFNQTPQPGGGKPNLTPVVVTNSLTLGDIAITPIPIKHGVLDIYGYRFNNIAYITDCSFIPTQSYKLLKNIDVLIINALRYRPHSTHFNLEQAINEVEKINPKRVFLTHICHDLEHQELINELETLGENKSFIKKIKPAHDGLCFSSN